MNTDRIYILDHDVANEFENIDYLDASNCDVSKIIDYVSIVDCLQEGYLLFDVFRFNFDKLIFFYKEKDIVAVNAHFISFLSSVTNLQVFCETCINTYCSQECVDYFKSSVLRAEYDYNFSYKVSSRLRNFTQHTHIPISYIDGQLCVNIEGIYNTPHYSFNKSLKNEMLILIEEVRKYYQDSLRLNIEYLVFHCVKSVYRIYSEFLQLINNEFICRYNNCYEIINTNTWAIEHSKHPRFRGYLFYKTSEKNALDGFNINEDNQKDTIRDRLLQMNILSIELENRLKDIDSHLVVKVD